MVGRHIPNALKEMVLSLSLQGLRESEVQECTGNSVRTLKRLQSTHRNSPAQPTCHGSATRTHCDRSKGMLQHFQTGHHLDYIQSLCDCVEHQPDIALTELQTELL